MSLSCLCLVPDSVLAAARHEVLRHQVVDLQKKKRSTPGCERGVKLIKHQPRAQARACARVCATHINTHAERDRHLVGVARTNPILS